MLTIQGRCPRKTHQGGVRVRPITPRVTNIYPNYENIDSCPVRLFGSTLVCYQILAKMDHYTCMHVKSPVLNAGIWITLWV